MYIFLSHSSKEYTIAEDLCHMLEERGHQCFLAPRDIRSGYEYAEEIIDGIERSEVMLLLLSEAANNSPHVLREIERAVSKKIKIVVYPLEQVNLSKSMEYFLMSHQWVNTAANASHAEIISHIEALAVGNEVSCGPEKSKENSKKKRAQCVWKKYCYLMIALLIVVVLACVAGYVIKQKGDTKASDSEQQKVQDTASDDLAQETEKLLPVPGDTVIFGAYLGEPIEWRVLKVNEDGTAVIVSSHILTMKAYDAAEGGKYNYQEGSYWMDNVKELDEEQQRNLRGSSQWSTSNIRTWLNSEMENVTYTDQAPKAAAMSELVNGYDAEPGFLSGFSEAELNAIVATKITTGEGISEDKVFLLSAKELLWFEEADVSRWAMPTESAIAQDKTGWYRMFALDYGVNDYYWWLRDAVETEGVISAYEAYVVANSYAEGQLIAKSAGLEGFGIRPAMTVDITADCIKIKDGKLQ